MEPASSAEFLLRTYEAFLLGLSLLLATCSGMVLVTYVTFFFAECLPPRHFSRPGHS